MDEKGCEPDGDNDGLPDRLDLCPNTPEGGKIDGMGCQADENIALEGVTFKLGTADLTEDSKKILDGVVAVLKQFPDLKLEVAGHTDNTGSRAINIALSEARAKAVANYLIDHGIAADRLEAKGYGPDEPVASNVTPEGRAINRRVELRRK